MNWHVLKTYGGSISGWHLCEYCFKEYRTKTVALAIKRNQSNGDDPNRLVDGSTWHPMTMEDLAGTNQYELYCAAPCDEYEENPDFVPDEPRVDVEEWEIDAVIARRDQQPQIRYFDNMPPDDPEAKQENKVTAPMFTTINTANVIWN